LGVIVLPITSGDTSFRRARMILADYFNFGQKQVWKRFAIAMPMFVISFILTTVDVTILWRYVSWASQTTATVAVWIVTMYLLLSTNNFCVAFITGIS